MTLVAPIALLILFLLGLWNKVFFIFFIGLSVFLLLVPKKRVLESKQIPLYGVSSLPRGEEDDDFHVSNFMQKLQDAWKNEHVGHGERCFDVSTPGESELLSILKTELDPKYYYIFNNIIVPTPDFKTTEIDHIVVSDQGIFIIENKDLKGRIYTPRTHKRWIQNLSPGNNYDFNNPLKQNWGHTLALKALFPRLPEHVFHPIVAFSNRDTKDKFPKGKPTGVLYYDEVASFIKSKPHALANSSKILMVIGRLSTICQTPPASREEHIEMLKREFDRKRLNI